MSGLGDFLGNIGNVAGGLAGLAAGLSGLGGADTITIPPADPNAARASGAGFRTIFTPDLLLDISTQDLGFLRTSGLNPGQVESDLRSRVRGLGDSFAGLRGGIGGNRTAAAGLRSGFSDLRTRSGQLRADVDSARGNLVSRFGGLRDQVAPGFGELTEARVGAIRSRRDEAVGNLRESLARRKVLGSSFGQDAVTRTELAFAQEESASRAQSFVEELGFSRQLAVEEATVSGQLSALAGQLLELDAQSLAEEAKTIALDMGLTEQDAGLLVQQLSGIQLEAQLLGQTVTRELTEAGVIADIANAVGANINQIANANVQATLLGAQLNAQAQAGAGAAVGGIGQALGQIGQGLGGIFG